MRHQSTTRRITTALASALGVALLSVVPVSSAQALDYRSGYGAGDPYQGYGAPINRLPWWMFPEPPKPEGNQAPHVYRAEYYATAMQRSTVDIMAYDPDEEPLTFRIVSGEQPWMRVDGNQFVFTPPEEVSGRFKVEVEASDGKAVDRETITLYVLPAQY